MSKEVLLPGEAQFDDDEFALIQFLLENHVRTASLALQKMKHLRREEDDER